MRGFTYPATLTPEEEGGFVVTFADFSEAITQGDDEADALAEAADCLEEAVAGRIAHGEPIPDPSPGGKGAHAVALPAQMAAKAALYLAMREAGITKVELARRLECDEKEVRRLLNPRHPSKLARIEAALAALGKRLVVAMDAAA
ncbi:MAG: type II toxin-antitoxin system HicB family antitoxin [Nitrospinota bacterium]